MHTCARVTQHYIAVNCIGPKRVGENITEKTADCDCVEWSIYCDELAMVSIGLNDSL